MQRNAYIRNYKPDPKGIDIMIINQELHDLEEESHEQKRSQSFSKTKNDYSENIYGLENRKKYPIMSRSHSRLSEKSHDPKRERLLFLKYVNLLRKNGKDISIDKKTEGELDKMLEKRRHDHQKSLDAHLINDARLSDGNYQITKKKPRPRDIMWKDKSLPLSNSSSTLSEEEIPLLNLKNLPNTKTLSTTKTSKIPQKSTDYNDSKMSSSTYSSKPNPKLSSEMFKSARLTINLQNHSPDHDKTHHSSMAVSKSTMDNLQAQCSRFYLEEGESQYLDMVQDYTSPDEVYQDESDFIDLKYQEAEDMLRRTKSLKGSRDPSRSRKHQVYDIMDNKTIVNSSSRENMNRFLRPSKQLFSITNKINQRKYHTTVSK